MAHDDSDALCPMLQVSFGKFWTPVAIAGAAEKVASTMAVASRSRRSATRVRLRVNAGSTRPSQSSVRASLPVCRRGWVRILCGNRMVVRAGAELSRDWVFVHAVNESVIMWP